MRMAPTSPSPPLLLIAHLLLTLALCTLPHTGALNVKSLRNVKSTTSSALPITEPSTAQGRLILGSAEAVKHKKAIVSKLKRFDTPYASISAAGSTPQVDDWHIKAWERSKHRVNQLASSVTKRASAYSAWLKSKNLDPATDGTVELMKQFNNEIKADVISTTGNPVGDYYVPAAVGSTGQQQRLKLDTGTGLSWIQCDPCTACFDQGEDLPVYDPSASQTYAAVECDNRICTQFNGAVNYSCVDLEGSSVCAYSTTYLDSSTSAGTMSLDSLALQAVDDNSVALTQWLYGCGHDNRGSFGGGQTGVLGLDRSEFSFISQLSQSEGYDFAQSFAYCLPDRVASSDDDDAGEGEGEGGGGGAGAGEGDEEGGGGAEGHIIFGGTDGYYSGYNFSRTPILSSDVNPYLYYVGLTGITVNDTSAGVTEALTGVQSDGSGGTILGTGLDGLWLSEGVYEAVVAALQAGTADLEQTQDVQATTRLGLCYNVQPDDSYVGVPELKLYFQGTDDSGTAVELVLPRYNYFVPVNSERTVFCYSVYQQEEGSLSVIGHSVLANHIVEYNLDTSEFAIAFNDGCVLPEADAGGAAEGGDQGAQDGGAGDDAGGDGGGEGGEEGGEGAGEGGEEGGEDGEAGGGEDGGDQAADGGDEGGEDGEAAGEDGGGDEGGEGGEGGDEAQEGGEAQEGEGEGEEGGEGEGEGGEGGDAEAGGGEGEGEGGNK